MRIRTILVVLPLLPLLPLSPRPAHADVPRGDVSAPTVEVTSPADQAKVEVPGRITVAVSASDADGPNEPASGIESVLLSIDGKPLAPDAAPPYEWADLELAEGMHEISAMALDKAGNRANSKIIHVVGFPATPAAPAAPPAPPAPPAPAAPAAPAEGCSVTNLEASQPHEWLTALLLLALVSKPRNRRT